MTPVPDTGTDHRTNRARAPRSSPPQLHYGEAARALRAHRNNGSTTRAARGADAEMTETSGPQESDHPLPAAATCSMLQQREPTTGYVPGGHPGTTQWHASPTSATPDQNRETVAPPSPQPPQRRSTGPFDDAQLRALYGIHSTTPSSELVAALREHLQDVNPSRLFAVVPLPHAATTEIFVLQLQALVMPGTQIADDLVDAWIWWFNTTDRPQARTQHRGPGAGRPPAES